MACGPRACLRGRCCARGRTLDRTRNQRLLVSVFNPQEAREAILGGARIVDSEDPRSALGNIKPRHIMAISDAVLNYRRDLEVQLSTNIGEDQLLFDRSPTGLAIEKSPYEIAGKAAQAAIGVACAMGTRVHPCNIVKVGLDGMSAPMVTEVLQEVVLTMRRTEHYGHTQVMSVLFVQDLDLWDLRKTDRAVREELVALREFHPVHSQELGAFDLREYAVNTLRDRDGHVLFTHPGQVDLESLTAKGVLPDGSTHTYIALNELFPHARYGLSSDPTNRRTNEEVIAKMVDATVAAGADCIMLDTSILMKVARVSLLKTSGDARLADVNILDDGEGKKFPREGVLSLKEIEFFIQYCHFRGVEANLAGSLYSQHAQQLWKLVPSADQMSTRGGSTAVAKNPASASSGGDTRHERVTHRNLVRGLAPPQHGGCLNVPKTFANRPGAAPIIEQLHRTCDVPAFWVDSEGQQTSF